MSHTVQGGDVVAVALHGDGWSYKARWVYVLDVDRMGERGAGAAGGVLS